MGETPEIRLKRLRYRAQCRGFKEADLLIGGFARARLSELEADELDQFEALLNESDWDIYGWVMGSAAPPEHMDTPLLAAMRRYVAEGDAAGDVQGAAAKDGGAGRD